MFSGKLYLLDKNRKGEFNVFRQMLVLILPRAEQAILIVICTATYLKPNSPNFIHSVFPWQHPAFLTIFLLIEVLLLINIYTVANFVFLACFYYVFSSNFWLKKLVGLR